jgi:Fe-S cluster assembly protein SufD
MVSFSMSAVLSGSRVAYDQADFGTFCSRNAEPSWVNGSRQSAWNLFLKMDWPSRNQEQWMRSDLRGFKLENYLDLTDWKFAGQGSECDANVSSCLGQGVETAGSVKTLNGVMTSATLESEVRGRGVVFGDLSTACSGPLSSIIQQHLGKVVPSSEDRFAALQSALWQGGQVLYVPRGTVIERPFHIVNSMSDGGSDLGRTLVIVEEGAQATLLQETASPNAASAGFHCGTLEIVVKAGGNLRYVHLQDWGRKSWHFAHHRADVGRDANLQWTVAALGSRFSQVSQHVKLSGPGANCQVNGVLFTQEKQQLVYNTLQHHAAPECRSDFLYKSALQDQSRTVWRGMIQVDKAAQKTDGYQRNDNLLLSDQARADSIPGLEIEADDVRCTHGSTSGKVDEELIFYAQSRGFTRREAVRMIVSGFFQQISDRITIESVREALSQAIARQVREYN